MLALAIAVLVAAAPGEPDIARRVLDELRAAEAVATTNPAAALEPLRGALDAARVHASDVAADAEVQRARLYAAMALAHAWLVGGNEAQARAVIDEAIAIAQGDPLPAELYGPRLRALVTARVEAPEHRLMGKLEIECRSPCRVLLDERIVGTGSGVSLAGLPLGSHRLRIERDPGHDAALVRTVDLTPEAAVTVVYAPRVSPASIEHAPTDLARPRRLPRWAGILGVASGAAIAIAGGVLLGVDGRCPDLSDPAGTDACANVLATNVAGIVLLAAGGATLTGFSIALGVGEARGRRNAQALVTYRLRF